MSSVPKEWENDVEELLDPTAGVEGWNSVGAHFALGGE